MWVEYSFRYQPGASQILEVERNLSRIVESLLDIMPVIANFIVLIFMNAEDVLAMLDLKLFASLRRIYDVVQERRLRAAAISGS